MGAESFHPEVEAEGLDATLYDEHRTPDLGRSFLTELRRCIDEILAHPESGVAVGAGVRKRLLRRFPYGVLYVPESDRVFIVAVMHLHRRPDYWRSRLTS